MREQDIRKILSEVCETIDRQRMLASRVAVGTALAFAVNCTHDESVALYMAPVDSGDARVTETGSSASSTTSTTSSSVGDGGTETSSDSSIVPAYMVSFPDASIDTDGAVTKYMAPTDAAPDATPDADARDTSVIAPAYMATFTDSSVSPVDGAVVKYMAPTDAASEIAAQDALVVLPEYMAAFPEAGTGN